MLVVSTLFLALWILIATIAARDEALHVRFVATLQNELLDDGSIDLAVV